MLPPLCSRGSKAVPTPLPFLIYFLFTRRCWIRPWCRLLNKAAGQGGLEIRLWKGGWLSRECARLRSKEHHCMASFLLVSLMQRPSSEVIKSETFELETLEGVPMTVHAEPSIPNENITMHLSVMMFWEPTYAGIPHSRETSASV